MTVTTTPARPAVAPQAATPDPAQRITELRATLAESEAQRDTLIARVRNDGRLTDAEQAWLEERSRLNDELFGLEDRLSGRPALPSPKAPCLTNEEIHAIAAAALEQQAKDLAGGYRMEPVVYLRDAIRKALARQTELTAAGQRLPID